MDGLKLEGLPRYYYYVNIRMPQNLKLTFETFHEHDEPGTRACAVLPPSSVYENIVKAWCLVSAATWCQSLYLQAWQPSLNFSEQAKLFF